MKNTLIIGGDNRQKHLKKILSEKGYTCFHIDSAEKIFMLKEKYDIIILPLPVSKDGRYIYCDDKELKVSFGDVTETVDGKTLIIGGAFNDEATEIMKDKGIEFYDFYRSEDFTVRNAYLTVQGAIRELLINTQKSIVSADVLVLGYGRIGKALSETLRANRMRVYICARNSLQLTVAECSGFRTITFDQIKSSVFHFDYIFNTVPFNVLGYSDIKHFDGKYFELASAPFGTKKEYFEGKTENYIDCSSLPGRFLPVSSAEIISDSVTGYIRDRKGGD